jgi:short-subunit dehydrogenase
MAQPTVLITGASSGIGAVAARGAEVLPLDGLLNNAGFGEVGPLETMPLERARAIFEVNVSSIAGRWVSPASGCRWY